MDALLNDKDNQDGFAYDSDLGRASPHCEGMIQALAVQERVSLFDAAPSETSPSVLETFINDWGSDMEDAGAEAAIASLKAAPERLNPSQNRRAGTSGRFLPRR